MECISDELIKQFFLTSLFGNLHEQDTIIKKASGRAYLDLCRTLRLKGKIEESKRAYEKTVALIDRDIRKLLDARTQESFDNLHNEICNKLIRTYNAEGIAFHYGQAQKWINMTMKYLHVIKPENLSLEGSFPYLHVPIDQIILKCAEAELNVPVRNFTWSTYDYDGYIQIQKAIREKLKSRKTFPLEWEFEAWNRL